MPMANTSSDRDDRARDIHEAALALIARGGYRALTLRSLADELGGSMTLVTYYFPTHSDLMQSVLEYQLAEFDAELRGLEQGADAVTRLQILIDWFLPNDAESWSQEHGRVLMLSQIGGDSEWLRPYLDRVEERMTELLREHLRPLVPEVELANATDALRLGLNGIVLSAVEHPDLWPPELQSEVMGIVLASLPLRGAAVAART